MFRYLLVISFLFAGISFFAQTYHPILDHESEWHVTSCFGGCLTDVYYTDGDTLENGITYKILDGYHYISRTFWLRENSSEQKIYMSYVDAIRGREEVLLYDFSLIVGDTMDIRNPNSPFPFDGGVFNVDSIISLPLFDGQNHRVYYFSPGVGNSSTEHPVWIEGVGSLSIVNAAGGTPNINTVGKVSCYFDDGFLNYSQLDSISGCSPIYVTELNENNVRDFTIYPTICHDFLNIIASVEFEQVRVFNSFDQLLIRGKLEIESQLDLRNLSGGIYWIELKGKNNKAVRQRIIKE